MTTDDGREPLTHRAGPFDLLGLTFTLRSASAEVLATLSASVRHLATASEGGYADIIYEVHEFTEPHDGASYLLVSDDGELVSADRGDLVAAFLRHLVERSMSASPYLLIHSSGVSAAGEAVAFPGPSGSGKSTLAAALVPSGFDYLSDEIVAVDLGTAECLPFPKSIKLEASSPAVPPGRRSGPIVERGTSGAPVWYIDPEDLQVGSVAGRSELRLVIFPTYTPDRPTELRAIARSDALVRISQNTADLARHGRRGLEVLADVLRRCDCYEMDMSDLDEAVELVRATFAETSTSPAPSP